MNPADSGGNVLVPLPAVQNTVRLYEQLLARGYAEDDLRRLRSACAVAQSLFSGHMHPSGKPLLAHCIGTAAILAALATSMDSIVAALVHDAYRHGDFGPWRFLAALRRQRLRRALGREAEELVWRHDDRRWGEAEISELRREIPQDLTDRAIVRIRLACELDHLRDRGILYSAEAEASREQTRARGPALVAIAEGLGLPALANALSTAIEETLAGEVPPELRSNVGRTAVFPPESATPRLESAIVTGIIAAVRPGGRRAP